MSFQRAVKTQAKLRIALTGPAGSGKTYSALVLAKVLGGRTALADSEHGSASKYADLFEFDTCELTEFSIDSYLRTIQEAQAAKYDVLVIDSLTHAWTGKGGALEEVDARGGNNKFTNGWKVVTPKQTKLVDSIVAYDGHIIATMRSKMAYEIAERDGKKVPMKIGLAPIQRDGMEYEFDVHIELTVDGSMHVSKTRCPELRDGVGRYEDLPKWATILKAWADGGAKPEAKPVSAQPLAPQPNVMVEQLEIAISETNNLPALERLGQNIAKLPPDTRNGIRPAYNKRAAELKSRKLEIQDVG